MDEVQDISILQDKVMNIDSITNSLKNAIKAAVKKIYSKQPFVLNVVITREDSSLYTDLDFLTDELQEEHLIQLEKIVDFSGVKENLFSKITALNGEERCGGQRSRNHRPASHRPETSPLPLAFRRRKITDERKPLRILIASTGRTHGLLRRETIPRQAAFPVDL